jgi:hypothetical protein
LPALRVGVDLFFEPRFNARKNTLNGSLYFFFQHRICSLRQFFIFLILRDGLFGKRQCAQHT